jgi:intergrase/recombinase
LVYTCIFNAGAASRIRIRGYGVNETLAADHKTSVVNDFILGRAQQRIGSTAGAYMNVWEILYYNRVLSEDELGMNSHWLGGVYKFSTFK